LEEARYFLLLAGDLRLLNPEKYAQLEDGSENISKMLNGLIKTLKSTKTKPA
jgi:four helix bundle protein